MVASGSVSGPGADRGARFPTTHWSVVLRAGATNDEASGRALATLCEAYWFPLYVFVRRRGYDREDAQDLTQGFFAKVLEKGYFGEADQDRGKFRTFLLTSLKHFLSNEADRARAKKRGGGRPQLSLDFETAEGSLRLEPADNLTPEKVFERQWAEAVLEKALGRLRLGSTRTGKEEIFDRLRGFLTTADAQAPYSDLARDLKTTEGAVRTAVHRLRKSFAEAVRAEIAQTVDDPKEVEEEIQNLFAVFSA